MKIDNKTSKQILDAFFARTARPTRNQIDSSRRKIFEKLETFQFGRFDIASPRTERRWFLRVAIGTCAIAIAIFATSTILRTNPMMAEAKNGTLYRVSKGGPQEIQPGEKIRDGELIRTDDGGVLALADGSTVHVGSKSELSINATTSGMRIRINRGGVVVNGARETQRSLDVETTDLTASIPGTVSLVSSEQEGSRVAVVQGEVQVYGGGKAQKLYPGDQIVTSRTMAALAPTSLAFLGQAASLLGAPPERFEAASIRLSAPPPQGSRGGGFSPKTGENIMPNEQPCFIPQRLQVNPGRIIIERATLHGLIAAAYGVSCTLADAISGEPDWAKSLRFDIQATIPSGTPPSSGDALLDGRAPQLQHMLQNLLADRFKLVLGRELKQMPAFDLVAARPGKWDCHLPVSCHGLRLSADQAPDGAAIDNEGRLETISTLNLHTTIARWAGIVSLNAGRPVVDKTGLKGFYDIRLEYPDLPDPASEGRKRVQEVMAQRFPSVIEEQLGFKLVPSTALVEVLNVQHFEKPSEN